MIIPPVAIVGDSGTGKSTSIQKLNKKSTKILNIERKILPFREAFQWEKNLMIESANDFDGALDSALKEVDVDVIVVESYTRYSDKLLELSKKINKGYDIYNFYADKMTSLHNKMLHAEKLIFFMCIPEWVELMNDNGGKSTKRRIGVNGQKLENKIESYFSIVLYTEVKIDPVSKKSSYNFITNADGTNSAKSPAGMFEQVIPNDLEFVRKKMFEYYGIQEKQPLTKLG